MHQQDKRLVWLQPEDLVFLEVVPNLNNWTKIWLLNKQKNDIDHL
jgi:hypothetical protein